MALFVYVTKQCQQDATKHQLKSELQELVARIEQQQALWSLDAFLHPFWVKKRLGNRHTRLICRIESHTVGGEVHDVLVMMSIMQRGSREYEDLFVNIAQKGEALYQRTVVREDILSHLSLRLTAQDVPHKPSLSIDETGLLYGVRNQHQHTEHQFQQEMVYDSWTWVEHSPTHLDQQDLQQIALQLRQIIDHQADEGVHELGVFGHYRARLWHSGHRRFAYLTLESVDTQVIPHDRQVSIDELDGLAQQDDLEALQHKLCQGARRAYPFITLADEQAWLHIQADQTANLALSPEEAAILATTQQQDRPFPLFINGRAGSGKSTVLQYLFADYLHHQMTTPNLVPLAYFSCNRSLVDRAAKTMINVLQHSCRYQQHLSEHLSAQVAASCYEFRQYLMSLLSSEARGLFDPTLRMSYGRFRQLWQAKFGKMPEKNRYSASLCWHVIRCYIKGRQADAWLDPEEYRELHENDRQLDPQIFNHIEKKVWKDWYEPLCRERQYWDDQDLARYVLQNNLIKPTFGAIFCDESQDFTRIELQIILRLSVFSDRQLQPHEIQRVPLVFAGDQFQTLNPTGFRWEAVKAQVMEQFVFALDPAKHSSTAEMNYRELSFNFRSSHRIADFSNIVHGLRARLLAESRLKPQQSWYCNPHSREVVFVNQQDELLFQQLQQQRDVVVVLPCNDGQEAEYIAADPVLQAWLKPQHHGITQTPCISVISAKGLEFERVVMYGFAQDRPSSLLNMTPQKGASDQLINTEYYLNKLYVAVTRARSQLVIVDGAQDYHTFWQHFANAGQPPFGLANLERDDQPWLPFLGTIRAAQLDDLTPDADDIRNMQMNAEQFAMQGRELEDSQLLLQAANLYEQLGLWPLQRHCLADAYAIQGNYQQAAELFEDIERWSDAYRNYWRAACWDGVLRIVNTQQVCGQEPEALVVRLLCREQRSLPLYIEVLQKLQTIAPNLADYSADRQAWQQAFLQLIPQIPIEDQPSRWAQLLPCLQWLHQISWLASTVPASVLAQVAYQAQDLVLACQYWDDAQRVEKLPPPHPQYAQAIIQTRHFPDNAQALIDLKRHEVLYRELTAYQDAPRLPTVLWSNMLKMLRPQHAQHEQLVQYYLSRSTHLELLDQLIQEIGLVRTNSTWFRQAKKVRLFRAVQQLQWPVVFEGLKALTGQQLTLNQLRRLMINSQKQKQHKSIKLEESQLLTLQALSISEALQMQGTDRHDSDEMTKLLKMLKQLFASIEKRTTKERHKSSQKETVVWHVDSESALVLGAVLERCAHFNEMLTFYEQLESVEQHAEYAKQRWLLCKYRQAANFERMQDDYLRKADQFVDVLRKEEYLQRAQDSAKRAQDAYQRADECRALCKISQEHINALPEYPVLFDADQVCLQLLGLNQPVSLWLDVPDTLAHPNVSDPNSDTLIDVDVAVVPAHDESPTVVLVADTPETVEAATEHAYPDETETVDTATTTCVPDVASEMIKDDQVLAVADLLLTDIQAVSVTADDVEQCDIPLVSDTTPPVVADEAIANDTTPLRLEVAAIEVEPIVTQAATAQPDAEMVSILPTAALLPRTELTLMDYRLLLVRQTRRLNIEHLLTGEQVSIRIDQQLAQGDWSLQAQPSGDEYALVGTPWLLQFEPASHRCRVLWPAYGIDLGLQY